MRLPLFLTLLFLSTFSLFASPESYLKPDPTSCPSASENITPIIDYASFLNAVATSDPHHLYDLKMGDTPALGEALVRVGPPGEYAYAKLASSVSAPTTREKAENELTISLISQVDAVRLLNALENSKRTGDLSDTENATGEGSYTLYFSINSRANNNYELPTANCEGSSRSDVIDPLLKSNQLFFHFALKHEELAMTADSDQAGVEKLVGYEALLFVVGVTYLFSVGDPNHPYLVISGDGSIHAQVPRATGAALHQPLREESALAIHDPSFPPALAHPFDVWTRKRISPKGAMQLFVRIFNHENGLGKKILSYNQQVHLPDFANISTSSLRNTFIPLFQKANNYQIEIINHALRHYNAENPPALFSKNEYHVQTLRVLNKINEKPNQVEQLINHIEKEDQERTNCETRLEEIETRIRDLQSRGQAIPEKLTKSVSHFNEAIPFYNQLLPLRRESAEWITLPYKNETIDEQMRNAREAGRSNFIRISTDARLNYLRGENEYLETILSPHLYGLNHSPLSHLRSADDALCNAAQEAQKPQPNQQAIEYYLRSAELYQEAATALKNEVYSAYITPASHLNNAGSALSRAAEEAQKDRPRQKVIKHYLRSAELYQEAATAFVENPYDPNMVD